MWPASNAIAKHVQDRPGDERNHQERCRRNHDLLQEEGEDVECESAHIKTPAAAHTNPRPRTRRSASVKKPWQTPDPLSVGPATPLRQVYPRCSAMYKRMFAGLTVSDDPPADLTAKMRRARRLTRRRRRS